MLDIAVPKKAKDVVLVHSPTEDGNGVNVVRARQQGLELGTMRPLTEGRPIHGEVVKLTPRSEMPLLYDVETELPQAGQEETVKDASASEAKESRGSSGPAQVASESYRRNWDAIWKRPTKRLSN